MFTLSYANIAIKYLQQYRLLLLHNVGNVKDQLQEITVMTAVAAVTGRHVGQSDACVLPTAGEFGISD